MSKNDRDSDTEVRVVLPDELPVVTEGTVRVLLRMVRAAAVRTDEYDEAEQEAA